MVFLLILTFVLKPQGSRLPDEAESLKNMFTLRCGCDMMPLAVPRYVNSKAAKALFRAGELERAEKMAALFTKDAASPEALVDMQVFSYAWAQPTSLYLLLNLLSPDLD